MVRVLLLGCATLLAAGALGFGVVLRKRWSRTRSATTFPCRIRVTAGSVPGLSERWSRSIRYGFWLHDVLVLFRGVALGKTAMLPVQSARGAVLARDPGSPTRLGPSARSLTFVLDGGAVIDVAAPSEAQTLLAGPYLCAVLGDDSSRGAPRRRAKPP